MRLQKITTFYSGYLSRFYAGRPDLSTQPYAAQYSALMADCFSWADFWAVALGKLGYEAGEVISNVEPMQKRWAAEHNVSFSENNWAHEITLAQIKAFAPDILFSADYSAFDATFLRRLKAECTSIRLVLGWCGAPYSDASVFREYDIVLSCVPELVEHFLSEGHRCHHVNHAFEPRVLEKLELVKRTDLQLWSNVNQTSSQQRYATAIRQLAYDAVYDARRIGLPRALLQSVPLVRKAAQWETRPSLPEDLASEIARRANPPLYGLAMYQKLRDSRVVLNTHIDISTTSASNMRLFEGTGVGSCLLTDWKENICELFEPETEVVTYRSAEECIEKVNYLLSHEDERRQIAAAGQRRTLRDHTIARRAEQLDAIIRAAV